MSASGNTDRRDLIKPFPAGSYCARVYCGPKEWCYQVVEPYGMFEGRLNVHVIVSDGGAWNSATVPVSWLRGSARELAEALCEEMHRCTM